MKPCTVIGVDVGGTKIAAGTVLFPEGLVQAHRTFPTLAQRGTDAVLADLERIVSELSAESGRAGRPGTQRPYASRGAFAARRGDYVGVVDDEDELLGTEEIDGDEEDEV